MSIITQLKIYFLYFMQFLKTKLAYKADFFASMLASLIASGTGLALIFLLIDGHIVQSLNQWNRDMILLIYSYSMMAIALFALFSPNLYQFGDRYIIQGEFDRVLLRPVNSLFQILFETFNIESLGNFFLGFGLFCYSINSLDIHLGLAEYFWILISIPCSAIIILCLFIIITSLSFHFEDRFGLTPPLYNIMQFSRYPLPIFNPFIQFLLTFILPFGFVSFFPASFFLHIAEYKTISLLTPVVALICVVLTSIFWKWGVSQYKSTGN